MTTHSLPEDVLDRARQYRGAGDERAWEMADWISGVVNGNTRTRGDRTRALKQLAMAMGVSRATTSDLCQLAETYEPGVREQFAEYLTIGHFREAMRCKAARPAKLLDQAVESSDEWNGQPMPVDVLRAIVRKHNAGIEPAKGPKELYALALGRAWKALGDALDLCPREHHAKLVEMYGWLSEVTA